MKTITSFFPVKKSRVADDEDRSSSTKRSAEDVIVPSSTSDQDRISADSSNCSSNKRVKQVTPQVQELISLLVNNEQALSWSKALRNHFHSSSFEHLATFVAQERLQHTVFPKPADTFAALTMTPLDQVKVVIVGQDPYHGPGQAHGLCFSVLPGQPVPPSLKNVYQELRDDPGVDFPRQGTMPNHGHLSRWARQGVLLLNTVLTVRRGQAHSHKNRGWEVVTDEILRVLDKYCRQQQNKGVVFLLWGKPAATKAQALISSHSPHTIIATSHPSPLGARKTNKPFLGSRCFSQCNEALVAKGYKPIDWNVDGPLDE